MRSTIALCLLLSACFDLNALDYMTMPAAVDMNMDMAIPPGADLSTGSQPDGAMPSPDLSTPVYWLNTYNGNKPLRAISGSGGLIIAVGDGGTSIVAGGSNGKSFTSENSGSATNFTAVWAIANNDVWIVGKDGGRIFHYDGSQYVNATMIPGIAYQAVAAASTSQVIAVGDDPNNAGQFKMANMYQWRTIAHNLGAKQHGMWASSKQIWTVGENAVGGYYDTTLALWVPQNITASASNITFNGVWGSSDTDVWAVGTMGNISHLSGIAFGVVPSGTTTTLRAIWGQSASDIWAVGDNQTILNGNECMRPGSHSAARRDRSRTRGGHPTCAQPPRLAALRSGGGDPGRDEVGTSGRTGGPPRQLLVCSGHASPA